MDRTQSGGDASGSQQFPDVSEWTDAQIDQAIRDGQEAAGMLGNEAFQRMFSSLTAEYYYRFRGTDAIETKKREQLYFEGRALDALRERMVEVAQFGHYLTELRQPLTSEEREQDAMNRQGFGLDENYNATR